MTEPLTPVDCDLRDFAFMPLDVVRLRDSDLAIQVSGEEFRCAVMLWCASWHQVPAASLPDDDVTLSALAGFGRAVSAWKEVRENSLRGWIKCSDGRLYHPVVAEKAVDAWQAKLRQRWKTECSRIKKHNQRHETSHPVPEFDEWMSLGCPQGQSLYVPRTSADCPEDKPDLSSGTNGTCPDSVPGEMASKGQGEGQGQGYIKEIPPVVPHAPANPETLTAKKARVKAERMTLQTFLANCKTRGEKPISDYEPLARYMAESGLPADFVNLCWAEFKREFLPGGKSERKQQAQWRRHFQNFVERNFFRLWYAKPQGDGVVYELTTVGLQAQAAQKHREAA